MAAYYQLWNDETHNLIDEFDSEADAFQEVRWRYQVWGEGVVEHLSLLRLETGEKPIAVALGDELLRRAQEASGLRAGVE